MRQQRRVVGEYRGGCHGAASVSSGPGLRLPRTGAAAAPLSDSFKTSSPLRLAPAFHPALLPLMERQQHGEAGDSPGVGPRVHCLLGPSLGTIG